MTTIYRYATRPLAFLLHYLRIRWIAHGLILLAVLGAVGCSVGTQYGVKLLIDALSGRAPSGDGPWNAFALLVALIACDNLLWRVASLIACSCFVHVTGDVRRDLFRHITGHAPSYFADQLPGALTSRISATSNAAFAIENMFVCNVLPPCAAVLASIGFLIVVSKTMAAALTVAAGIAVFALFRLASRGRPLHHDFADKAAAVDGEMIDVVGNIALVKSFCGLGRERRRFETTVDRELQARRRSLIYLEKLRLIHAVTTIALTLALLAWAIRLWQGGAASVGDVVLVCTLSISVLSATRDLAVALVDVTQHMARLAEALETLLVPPALCDCPHAALLVLNRGGVAFENVAFGYRGGHKVFENFSLSFKPGERIGLVGRSGGGKSTLFALLQRFYDVDAGRILIDGQDVAHVTQDSLHQAMAVVPQDTALFNRTLRENIRYGRPEASDADVWEAAIAARCGRIIETLPEGLDTMVGDRGVKLSGGQRQRIAIARAFLKNAPILLLDEATSALDSEAEEAIREALARLMRGRTVIAIAHRLSTLRDFDRIVLLHGGRIIQSGAPELLLRQDGPYRDLVDHELSRLSFQAA